jgi:hypothetical protein
MLISHFIPLWPEKIVSVISLLNLLRLVLGWALVANASNPSYSGGRDQEDHSSKQPGQIVPKTLSQKYPSPKKTGGVAQGEGTEFKPQYCKNKTCLGT